MTDLLDSGFVGGEMTAIKSVEIRKPGRATVGRVLRHRAILATLIALAGNSASAEDLSFIEGGAFVNTQGLVQVNVAAGDGNAEANAAVLLKSQNKEDLSGAPLFVEQSGFVHLSESVGHRSAAILDNAFQGAAGLIMVNVVAGSNNQLANATSVLVGDAVKPVSDSILSQGYAPSGAENKTQSAEASRGKAKIDDSAFNGASGVIQVTVASGSGNRLANELALNVGVGARP